jgi:predicted metal-dependent hydrolase
MLLLDIEKQVKPLSLADKQQLIRDVQRMIEEETLHQLVRSDVVYDIDTPNITADESELESVSQAVQQLREEHPEAF